MWSFTNQSATDAAGANTEAGFIAGNQPFAEADSLASKRNVVATEKGWVRRQSYTDVHGYLRQKEEVLIAAHPGGANNGGYSNTVYLGSADIATMQLTSNTATGVSTYQNTASMSVYVTFNEPLLATTNTTIVATERSGAPTFTLTSNSGTGATSKSVFLNEGANNTLVFSGIPGVGAGTYKFGAQDITVVAGGTLLSQNWDNDAADLTITGAVSNTTMNVAGAVLANGEFTLV
jgi:hypothetical protein